MVATILVVEDEVAMCNLIRTHLEAEGHSVIQAFDGHAALAAVPAHNPHLVILDWMLPGLDGLTVCRQIRNTHLMPIFMLTARAEEVDRVLGLEVGADDYLTKPYSIRELMARVRALLRRVELDSRVVPPAPPPPVKASTDAPASLVFGPLTIKAADRVVLLSGSELDLTPKEYDLLEMLTANPGRTFSREYLLRHIWGYEYNGFDRTVDAHMTRLRKKLGDAGEKIGTVWGVGYRFVG